MTRLPAGCNGSRWQKWINDVVQTNSGRCVLTESIWFVFSMRTRCWSWPRKGLTTRRSRCCRVCWKMPTAEKMNWRRRTGRHKHAANQSALCSNLLFFLFSPLILKSKGGKENVLVGSQTFENQNHFPTNIILVCSNILSVFLWIWFAHCCVKSSAVKPGLSLFFIKVNQSALDGGAESGRRATEDCSRTGFESRRCKSFYVCSVLCVNLWYQLKWHP